MSHQIEPEKHGFVPYEMPPSATSKNPAPFQTGLYSPLRYRPICCCFGRKVTRRTFWIVVGVEITLALLLAFLLAFFFWVRTPVVQIVGMAGAGKLNLGENPVFNPMLPEPFPMQFAQKTVGQLKWTPRWHVESAAGLDLDESVKETKNDELAPNRAALARSDDVSPLGGGGIPIKITTFQNPTREALITPRLGSDAGSANSLTGADFVQIYDRNGVHAGQQWIPGTKGVQVVNSSIVFRFDTLVMVENPNYISSRIDSIQSIFFMPDYDREHSVGWANASELYLTRRTNMTFAMPIEARYDLNSDPKRRALLDIAWRCGVLSDGLLGGLLRLLPPGWLGLPPGTDLSKQQKLKFEYESVAQYKALASYGTMTTGRTEIECECPTNSLGDDMLPGIGNIGQFVKELIAALLRGDNPVTATSAASSPSTSSSTPSATSSSTPSSSTTSSSSLRVSNFTPTLLF
ncbi:hypothetical protein GQ42DRAFT_73659 [Ramicandelaber brevisporus]|nr:hypothetical protein GQ42DRAFT_73659 [Ramicandelaber brevisporus]